MTSTYRRKDFEAARGWLSKLKPREDADSFGFDFASARLRLAELASRPAGEGDVPLAKRVDQPTASGASRDGEDRAALLATVTAPAQKRPEWYPVVTLAGQVADLNGDRKAAVEAYELAAKLGEQRTQVLKRLVNLLYGEHRYDDASNYLSQLANSDPVEIGMDNVAIGLAVQQGNLQGAIEIARAPLRTIHKTFSANCDWRCCYTNTTTARRLKTCCAERLNSFHTRSEPGTPTFPSWRRPISLTTPGAFWNN